MTDTPTLWRDMTPEEKGALYLAEHEGKTIEWLGWASATWREDGRKKSEYYFNLYYRIKPEPKRETVVLYGEEHLWAFDRASGGMDNTYKFTFDVIDGKPDPSSIKIEEL